MLSAKDEEQGVCKGSLACQSLLRRFLRSYNIPTTCLHSLRFRTPFDPELFESRGSYPGWLSLCCFNDKVRVTSSEPSCLAGPLLVERENGYQTFGVICTLLLVFILQFCMCSVHSIPSLRCFPACSGINLCKSAELELCIRTTAHLCVTLPATRRIAAKSS